MAAMLGVYTVLQKSDETTQRYRLAKLLQEEKRLDEEIVRENTRLSSLLSPQNLERLNLELNLGLQPLRRYQPGLEEQQPGDLYAKAVKRRVVQRQVSVPLPEFDAPAQPLRGGNGNTAPAVAAGAQKTQKTQITQAPVRRRDSRTAQMQERVQRINSLLAQQDAVNTNAAPALSATARGSQTAKPAVRADRQGR